MRLTSATKFLTIVTGVVILAVNAFPDTLTVQATADVYAAGHSTVPATIYPGTFPPLSTFASGPSQVLTFSSVTGMVGCNFAVTNGPDGTCWPGVDTTVTSYGGLSGISAKQANMFLVGVFLDSSEPSGAGPSILSYDSGIAGSLNTTDASFSPDLNQVFFIGDGLTGTGTGQEQSFYVPSTASRLYLGFADSFDYVPSYYADDVGSVTATFAFTTTAAPEPASIFFVACGLLLGGTLYRRKSLPT
jgi:hypothetical protein